MLYLPYAALLASVASAASIPEIPLNDHLRVDFSVLRGNSRSTAKKGAREGLVARDGLYNLELTNELSYYSSTLKVGSNGDENSVLVDTGSSDLWLMSADVACYARPNYKRSLNEISKPHRPVFGLENKKSEFERRDGQFNSLTVTPTTTSTGPARIDIASCTALGSFKTEASDSFHFNSTAPAFGIEYADGTFAKGIWGSDSVAIGSLNVPQCNFAIVNETTSDFGVFGIGLPDLEVTSADASVADEYTYENFPIRLKSTGVINKVAYSLYLNDVDSLTGSVLFGAVDHAKYSGQLQTVPIMNLYKKWYDHPITFHIVLNSIAIEDPSQQIAIWDTPFTALLDSGSTFSHLPLNVIQSLASLMDGVLTDGYYEVDCIYNTSTADAIFNFSGAQIRVPISDLIMSAEMAGDSKCYLGLRPHKDGSSTLGDNFLRHAYVVYDLENYEISLAQVKYTDEQNIEVIKSTVPLAVKAPGYSSTSFAHVSTSQPPVSRLTFATTTSHWTGVNTSTTTVTASGRVPTVVVEIPFELTSTSTGAVSYTTSEVVTGTDGLETLVVIVPQASSAVSFSSSTSSFAGSSSSSSPGSPSGSPSGFSSGSSYTVTSSGSVSAIYSSLGWNASYVAKSEFGSDIASSSASGFSSFSTEILTSVSTSINEAGATNFVTNTVTVTHCPGSCSLAAKSTSSSELSLTTATLTSVVASTNAEGSTVLVTKTFTTTYCPESSVSSSSSIVSSSQSSSLTTQTLTSVSSSTNGEGSVVLVTNTYTTTYCPESASTNKNKTTFVTVVQTVGKSSALSSGYTGQTSAASSADQVGISSQALAYRGSVTTAVLSAPGYVSGNSTFFASSLSAPVTSSVTILQGGSSALSILLTMLLVPLLALF